MTIKQNQTQQQRSTMMMIIATVVTVLFPSMSVAFTIISPPSSFSSSITHAISRRHSNSNNNNNDIKNCYLPQQQQQQHCLQNLDLYSSSIDDDDNDDTETTAVPILDDDDEEQQVVEEVVGDDDDSMSSSVRTPLKFIGSYPCLGLKFPNLSTDSQREKNITTGIALDFVLDTASNINTIQGPVAQQLQLEKLTDKRALPGVSSTGPIAGGDTFLLGDSQLEEVLLFSSSPAAALSSSSSLMDNTATDTVDHNKDDDHDEKKIIIQEKEELPFEFMQQLTASVLPGMANPGSAGLLGLAFFYCFEGGVEFRWGLDTQPQQQQQQVQEQQQQQQKEGVQEPKLVDGMVVQQQGSSSESSSQSSITFHGDENEKEFLRTLSRLTRVKIAPIPLTQVPTVRMKINNVEMVALLDTGSPVTVLNERAAKAAGIQTTKKGNDDDNNNNNNNNNKDKNKNNSWNPFASVVDKFKEAQATAEAASKGDVLMIGGIDGQPTNLYRSINDGISISLVADDNDDDISFGGGSSSKNTVYVGNIPGLAALNGIGVDSPPAVVLGLDILRKRPSMLLRARNNEVYF
ncbi:hypothetical protein FRACYDRAFT_269708 [Fragilariopsis cylindrus CCMP1102]|uniref:Peptidase A2 domain-containing protein n=1 Tax=Fragilariopsis cylindrus CCMP1102 TaxID=635003 RepID=A0A1E7F9Q0_9STRA|nr:hypothetical protein FRACYDRAFT_269708 [Fragilariopsis cylindrus CCMP1102]|eukprot:OEU14910.1 hypothetical protein FRACYDRAFT_269708 [Fragilariopsis cylindrus CCMP1102]